ncbi:hypothetical protein [Boseongicola aestuarii]|uniref:Galactosyltransferase Lgt5 n=1 Tax=Boseongicola aestuarii TaxID=1470561 RepID=A0A238J1N5_9RHOB|nr:hypothetical protein [Boseongicola aestuarii]SMX24112.1 hypothetical protein BOA8489_02229 [Boseongicola aestuarii]
MSRTARGRTRPATLWIGPRLSVIEQLCLTSFVRLGMEPVLYSYDPVEGVPTGVEVRDATQVLPRERVFLNDERQSYAPFSDVFRYRLLRDTDFYWVDADIYLCRPFPRDCGYLFGWAQGMISNCVLALPPHSPTLVALCDAFERPSIDLPWIRRFREAIRDRANADGTIDVAKLPYKALGPLALTWLLKRHGEVGRAFDNTLHAPIDPRHVLNTWRRARQRVRRSNPYAIHLYGSAQHRQMEVRNWDSIPEDSYLAHLLKAEGFGLTFYPDGPRLEEK